MIKWMLPLLCGYLSGCMVVESVAVKATGGLLQKGAKEIETEGNWQLFKTAAPGNIKMAEGLLYTDKENLDILAVLTKAYAGYAYGVDETLYLAEKLGDKDHKPNLQRAVTSYSKAVQYGLKYFELSSLKFDQIIKNAKDGTLNNYLDSHLDNKNSRDVETAFFTAQAWAGLINLQKQNTQLIGQIYLAKAIVDWVCRDYPDIQQGACYIADGMYHLSRPKMLGGKPKLGKKAFFDGFKKFPSNLLIKVAYIEYYVIPAMDEDEFKKQRSLIRDAIKKSKISYIPGAKSEQSKEGRLLNAIAKRRFHIINKYEKDIF